MDKANLFSALKIAVFSSLALSVLFIKILPFNGVDVLPARTTNSFTFSSILPGFTLAYDESGGFFKDIPAADWNLLKHRISTTPSCQDNCRPQEASHWYQNNWEPNFTCLHERRIGRWGDGGKWVCDPHRITRKETADPCLVYSIGSNNDFSFEEAIMNDISMGCEIHTFDPTIGKHPSNVPQYGNITFHPWGLANHDQGDYKTLPTIIKELKHDEREIDILKIDCEGCEWTTFSSWFRTDIVIRQILVELHEGTSTIDDDPPAASQFMKYLQSKGYVIFHKESNTLGCRGACIEYSFLRLNFNLDIERKISQ